MFNTNLFYGKKAVNNKLQQEHRETLFFYNKVNFGYLWQHVIKGLSPQPYAISYKSVLYKRGLHKNHDEYNEEGGETSSLKKKEWAK